MPVFVGLGVVREGDKSRMERGQLAKKRAEADALKQAFDLPFVTPEMAQNGESISIGAPDVEESVIEVPPESRRNGSDGAGNPEPPLIMPHRPMDPEELSGYIEIATDRKPSTDRTTPITDAQRGALRGLLGKLFEDSPTMKKDMAAYLKYLVGLSVPSAGSQWM